jgi:uncharacterized protein (TIGR03086 family)
MPLTSLDTFADLETTKNVCHGLAFAVERLQDSDFDCSTPCSEWTVREVLRHTIGGLHQAASLLGASDEERTKPAVDAFGVRRASRRFIIAMDQADLDARYETPLGRLYGASLASHLVLDVLVHTWDVSKGAGLRDLRLDDTTCERALRWSRHDIRDEHRGSHLGPAVELPPGAPYEEQLMAFLGRDPNAWR